MAGLAGFFAQEFPLLERYLMIFDRLFEEILPNLHAHFKSEGIPELLWIHKWFSTCFLYSFPLGLCIRIWDNIFVYGTKFILQASIAILKLIEDDLLQISFSDINEYLKHLKEEE